MGARANDRFSARNNRRDDDTRPIIGLVPPQDLDCEAECIEACIRSVTQRDEVLVVLKQEHFFSIPNGRIYEAIVALSLANSEITEVSVCSWLRDREMLDRVGGSAYVAQIGKDVPVRRYIEPAARRVYQKWRLRMLIAACQNIAIEGHGDVGEEQTFIDQAEQTIYEISHTETKQEYSHIKPLVKSTFAAIHAAADRGDKFTGISTGFERLDAKTAGLHPGDLTIVAARPGMGKTSFVLNMAVNIASPREEQGKPIRGRGVAFFTLEMPKEQLATRIICSEARMDLGKMRGNFLQPADWTRLTQAAQYIESLPLWIDDKAGLDLMTLRAKVRRIKAEAERPPFNGIELGLVAVDYLQLMSGVGREQNREQEISFISRGLKELAKELSVPVIALSQLNRDVEKRGGEKRPQISDLRESGAIEQDADNVLFIYRDDYYNQNSDLKGIAEINVAKQRNGPTGKVLTRFSASCTRFDNLAAGDYPALEDE